MGQKFPMVYPFNFKVAPERTNLVNLYIDSVHNFRLERMGVMVVGEKNQINSCCFELFDTGRALIVAEGKFNFVETSFIEISIPNYKFFANTKIRFKLENRSNDFINGEVVLSGWKEVMI